MVDVVNSELQDYQWLMVRGVCSFCYFTRSSKFIPLDDCSRDEINRFFSTSVEKGSICMMCFIEFLRWRNENVPGENVCYPSASSRSVSSNASMSSSIGSNEGRENFALSFVKKEALSSAQIETTKKRRTMKEKEEVISQISPDHCLHRSLCNGTLNYGLNEWANQTQHYRVSTSDGTIPERQLLIQQERFPPPQYQPFYGLFSQNESHCCCCREEQGSQCLPSQRELSTTHQLQSQMKTISQLRTEQQQQQQQQQRNQQQDDIIPLKFHQNKHSTNLESGSATPSFSTDYSDLANLSLLKVKALQDYLKKLNAPIKGSKAQLIQRLVRYIYIFNGNKDLTCFNTFSKEISSSGLDDNQTMSVGYSHRDLLSEKEDYHQRSL